jgi:hypothetical protein
LVAKLDFHAVLAQFPAFEVNLKDPKADEAFPIFTAAHRRLR